MLCNKCVLCLAFTLQPHAVWTSQGGKGRSEEFGLLHTELPASNTLYAIIFSTSRPQQPIPKFGNNDNYFPAPQPQDSDSVGLEAFAFSKAPL